VQTQGLAPRRDICVPALLKAMNWVLFWFALPFLINIKPL